MKKAKARGMRIGLAVDEFVEKCPVLVHYSLRGILEPRDGLLTAQQNVEANRSADGRVWARFQADDDWVQMEGRVLLERSRFRRRTAEAGCNLLVRSHRDPSRAYFLGNNYPLGDGSCIGSTIALTDNRDGDPVPTREDWFRVLNAMFWVFDANRVNKGFVEHLGNAAPDAGVAVLTINTRALPEGLLRERLRLSAINGGGSNGAAPRGTGTYKRLAEWNGRWPPKEIGFKDGIPKDVSEALMAAGAMNVTDK